MKTSLFDFDLPQECIAKHPVSPRDASRLMVVRANSLEDKRIIDLPELLREGDVMVFNNTRVIPARLSGKRGQVRIEVTLHKQIGEKAWRAFAKPGKRLHVGDSIVFSDDFTAIIKAKHESGEIDLLFNTNDFYKSLNQYGKMPLPHYMQRDASEADLQSYQTVYAQRDGAVAAPTAGLHFTDELLKILDNKGIKRVFVTLHVGAGTFQPVKTQDTTEHVMHSEYIEISKEVAYTINVSRETSKRILAIGTTSLRALESATDSQGRLAAYSGETNIFITPGYRFKAVDMLLTNFHLPKSTLFMLVSAFMGLGRMQEAYKHAIEAKYRFYSYGDACLLKP